ncbi:MAG: M48 family metalloprotease [Novosphingobium sp.]|nr:M48 family metalloprotease [Novosphingobium sp.]
MAQQQDKPLGYVTHAAQNRRRFARYVLGYIAAFQLIGAFALTVPLLIFDPLHTILSDPAGYALRYAAPLAAVSGLIFWSIYRGHADSVRAALDIRDVTRADEPRFVAIAEEQCTALGVRAPRFGVIEVDALNALTVGEGPARGLIAVTRGLLERLDDDELAAVLAHEASHIRNGDTRVLSANHALMRTAVTLQVNNPLRIEDWRQLLIPLFLPPFLLILIAGSTATMLALRMASGARRDIKLSRDHIADGEAVRMTHFPEALVSALGKIGGHGRFEGSRRIEALLFDGPSDHDGGTHPPIAERIAAITALGRDMIAPDRARKDTRGPATVRPRFGVQPRAVMAHAYACDEEGRPLEQPPTPSLSMHLLRFTDPPAYRRWNEAFFAWYEWRVSDQRNALGLTPKMLIPFVGLSAFLLVFHWPTDNDPAKFVNTFNPVTIAKVFNMVKVSGPTCEGPSYPDGQCGGTFAKVSRPVRSQRPNPWSSSAPADTRAAGQSGAIASDDRDSGPPDAFIPSLMVLGLFVAMVAQKQLKQLFAVVEDLAEQAGRTMAAQPEARPRERRTTPSPQPQVHTAPPPEPAPRIVPPRPPSGGFGRKGL